MNVVKLLLHVLDMDRCASQRFLQLRFRVR